MMKFIDWKMKYLFGSSCDVGSQYCANFKNATGIRSAPKKARNTNMIGLAGLLSLSSRRCTLRYMNR